MPLRNPFLPKALQSSNNWAIIAGVHILICFWLTRFGWKANKLKRASYGPQLWINSAQPEIFGAQGWYTVFWAGPHARQGIMNRLNWNITSAWNCLVQ